MATTLANISIKDSSSWNTYLNLIYPVGSYYLSNSSTSPSTRFGGTWTQIKDQRFLCGYTSITTGGANSVTLTIDQMPKHTHQFNLSVHASYFGGNSPTCSDIAANYDSTWPEVTGGQESRKPTLIPHLLHVVQNCIATLPLLEVI